MSTGWPILLFLFERGNFFKERKNERTLVFHSREKGKRGDKANRVKQKTTKAKHGLVKKRNRREPERENSSSTNIPRNSPNYPTHRKRHETKEQQSRARKKWLALRLVPRKMRTCQRFPSCFWKLNAIGSNPEEKLKPKLEKEKRYVRAHPPSCQKPKFGKQKSEHKTKRVTEEEEEGAETRS